jgi:hypothetical protein
MVKIIRPARKFAGENVDFYDMFIWPWLLQKGVANWGYSMYEYKSVKQV